MKRITLFALCLVLFATAVYGQATLSSTTLSSAVDKTTTSIYLASTTGLLSNQYLWVDKELMYVITVGTPTVVRRGAGTIVPGGPGGTQSHASGATVYYGPGSYFTTTDRAGSCTSTDELVLPLVNTSNGNIFNCISSAWTVISGPLSTATSITALTPNAAGTVDIGSATLPFRYGYIAGTSGTPGTNNFRLTGASTSGTRVITFPDASITVPGTVTQWCGTTAACAATGISATAKIATGSVALSSGTPSTATITGISPAFTATADYNCVVTKDGTTAATSVYSVSNVSASSFTITGPNTVTDTVHYVCVGF